MQATFRLSESYTTVVHPHPFPDIRAIAVQQHSIQIRPSLECGRRSIDNLLLRGSRALSGHGTATPSTYPGVPFFAGKKEGRPDPKLAKMRRFRGHRRDLRV